MKNKQEGRLLTEAQFQEWLRQLALTLGWLYYHTHRSIHSPAGFPDAVLVKPPRIIFAELKASGNQPTEDQWMWLYTLQHCPGVECYLWYPEDRDFIEVNLQNKLKELGID